MQPSKHRSAEARRTSGLREVLWVPRTQEVLVVLAVLLALEVLVFGSWFGGGIIPQYDFMGASNAEAYAWWHSGSFFAPPQWMPYLWGGYPAVSNLQNSSFYLPVGLASLFGPFTLHSAAVVAALHVALGAAGAYVFARRWGLGVSLSLVPLVGWFFAAGFYSNATQVDVSRGWAWLPWILLVTSARWPWFRPWAPVLAVLVLWQSVLAMPVGMSLALAWLVGAWIVLNVVLVRPRLRSYLLPLVVTVVAAGLLTLVRLLPGVIERGHFAGHTTDQSAVSLATIGTLLYPYDNEQLVSLVVLQSYFLPALFLPLIAFADWRSRIVQSLSGLVVLSALLGLPIWPWHAAVTNLPGLGASSFVSSDFKPVLVFGLLMLGTQGLVRLVADPAASARPGGPRVSARAWIVGALLALLVGGFAVVGHHYDFAPAATIPQWMLLAGTATVAWGFAFWPRARFDYRTVAIGAVCVVALSGVVGAFGVTSTWRAARVNAELAYYGNSVDNLIASAEPSGTVSQRPVRQSAPTPIDDQHIIYWQYETAFYRNAPAVTGYIDLNGVETSELIRARLYAGDQDAPSIRSFWQAAGVVISGAPDSVPSESRVSRCVSSGNCGSDLTVKPVAWNNSGHAEFDVTATAATGVMLNEAWYRGWEAKLCAADGTGCTALATASGSFGQLTTNLPKGHSLLVLDYRLPGLALAWILFGVGALLTALLTAFVVVTGRRSRITEGARDGRGTQPSLAEIPGPAV